MASVLFGSANRPRAATRARAFGCAVAVFAVVCVLPATASAAPGQVDQTFGHLANGTVLADHGHEDVVVKVLRQPDGKIVSVTHGDTADGRSTLVVSRYLTNGSLDPSFGTGGVFSPTISNIGFVTDAVLQPDGKIVVVGSTTTPEVFITRLLANGTFDPAFVAAHAPPGPSTRHSRSRSTRAARSSWPATRATTSPCGATRRAARSTRPSPATAWSPRASAPAISRSPKTSRCSPTTTSSSAATRSSDAMRRSPC